MEQQKTARFIEPEAARIEWLKSFEQRDRKRFFPSGVKSHDGAAGAFQRGGFYLVAGRPGNCKTAFLLKLAYEQARAGVKAFFVNIKMTIAAMWNRLACIHEPDLTLQELMQTEPTPERIRFFERLSCDLVNFSPLFFESSDFTAFHKAARETIERGSQSVLFIDYVGLFTLKSLGPQERYWLISEVAKQLKILARDLDIPIVGAVQLNRKVEDRKNKTPTLADLRDSGELENHADAVFALTRESDRIHVDILKNRNGPLAAYSLHFDGPRAAVEEFDEV